MPSLHVRKPRNTHHGLVEAVTEHKTSIPLAMQQPARTPHEVGVHAESASQLAVQHVQMVAEAGPNMQSL